MGILCQLPGCCEVGASNVPHHISKKDLHIDMSVPSLGVLLSQRLQRKASSQQQQRSQWRSQYDGAPSPDEKRDGGDSSADEDESTTEERTTAWTHRGRFGQDMTVKTSVVTLPAAHDHEAIAPEAQEQSIMRRWKNLMEPREPLPADLVSDSTPTPPKLQKRSYVDDATTYLQTGKHPEGSKRSVTHDSAIANATKRACNCSELLSNDTFSKVFYLVPAPAETTVQNRSLVKEIIRASLSKTVLVERLYGKGCHCSCNDTSLASIRASQSSSTETRPTTAETTKAIPTTAPCTASASTSVRLQEDRPQTLYATRTTASSSRGTKCPTRVFVKFPGEELPARATDCRKLWLPDSVYKGETFWECEDRGSADCGGGHVAASSTERTFLASRASGPPASSQSPRNLVYTRSSAWYSTRRRTAQPTSTTSRTETATSTRTTTSTAKRTVPTTPSKCGNAKDEDVSPGAHEKRAHKSTACAPVSSPNETADGWHLNFVVPFYHFGGNASKTGNATLLTTRAPWAENLRHRHYMTSRTTATKAKKTSAGRLTPTSISQTSRTTSGILSSSTRADTIQYNTARSTLPLSASKNETLLPAEWPQRCPKSGDYSTFNNSLAFILMCAPAASRSGAASCNGSGCEPTKRRVADDDRGQRSGTTDYRRRTHYHLHDDDDFTWTRGSRPVQVQSLPYRTSRNGTAFPYPFRGSDVSTTRNSNVFRLRGRNVTATSSRNGSQPNRDLPVILEVTSSSERSKPYFGDGTHTSKTTTDERYADIIFGAALERPASSRQRQRWAYKGYYREVARQFPHTDVKRYDADRDHVAGQRATTSANNGENRQRSRPPDKRAAISNEYAITEEKYSRHQLSPVKMDLLKSIISIKALVDKARSSGCKDALRCNANDAKNSNVLEKVVVRSGQPSEDDEYEYYYVDDDATSSQRPPDWKLRSVTMTSATARPAQGGS